MLNQKWNEESGRGRGNTAERHSSKQLSARVQEQQRQLFHPEGGGLFKGAASPVTTVEREREC